MNLIIIIVTNEVNKHCRWFGNPVKCCQHQIMKLLKKKLEIIKLRIKLLLDIYITSMRQLDLNERCKLKKIRLIGKANTFGSWFFKNSYVFNFSTNLSHCFCHSFLSLLVHPAIVVYQLKMIKNYSTLT